MDGSCNVKQDTVPQEKICKTKKGDTEVSSFLREINIYQLFVNVNLFTAVIAEQLFCNHHTICFSWFFHELTLLNGEDEAVISCI